MYDASIYENNTLMGERIAVELTNKQHEIHV